MSTRKCFHLLLGGALLIASLLFTFSSLGTPKAFAASINSCPPTQSENAGSNNSSWVEVLQYTLNGFAANGLFSFSNYPLSVDGQFGPKTESAVVAFQQTWSVKDILGLVGGNTWTELGYCTTGPGIITHGFFRSTHTVCPLGLSYGSSGILVQALQDMLNTAEYPYNRGLFSSTTPKTFTVYLASDGSFGLQTQNAVIDYQYAAGIRDDGNVGQQTWSVLGMCW